MFDFARFDYTTPRAIFSECQATQCPNLEINFIKEFLKRDYHVLFITINQPVVKLKKAFGSEGDNPQLTFVDCISRSADLPSRSANHASNIVYARKGTSLETTCTRVHDLWDSLSGKKLLFFDCAELLLTDMGDSKALAFIHAAAQKFQVNGIAVFCFLKDTMEKTTEVRMKHLFDQVIYL